MSNPLFTQAPVIGFARPTIGITASDGTGALDTLLTATTTTRVDQIIFRNSQAVYGAATTAITGKVFLTDITGSNPRLLEEVAIPSATRSASVIGSAASITFPGGLLIGASQSLKVCISTFNANSQVDIIAKAYTVA